MRLSLSANSQGETAEKLQDVEKEKSIELQNEKCQTNFFFFFRNRKSYYCEKRVIKILFREGIK